MKKLFLLLFSIFSMMSFANVNYNVFLKMDNKAEMAVSEISKELKKVGIDSLYSEGYIVHLTAYLTEYKPEELPKLKKVVNEMASKTKPFELEFFGIHKTAGNWLMLDNKNTRELQDLVDEITVKLNRYRALDAEVPGWAKSIPEKVKSFKAYGSPNVFMNFDPHITLLTPKDPEKIAQFMENYKLKPFTTKVIGIGIAEVDSLGQAQGKKVLYEVNFKK